MLQRATSTSGFLDFCAVNLANNRHTFKRFYVTYLIRFKLLIRFKFLQVKQVVDLSQVYGEVRLEAKRGLISPDYSTTRVVTTGKWLFKLRWNNSENVATVSVSHRLSCTFINFEPVQILMWVNSSDTLINSHTLVRPEATTIDTTLIQTLVYRFSILTFNTDIWCVLNSSIVLLCCHMTSYD